MSLLLLIIIPFAFNIPDDRFTTEDGIASLYVCQNGSISENKLVEIYGEKQTTFRKFLTK